MSFHQLELIIQTILSDFLCYTLKKQSTIIHLKYIKSIGVINEGEW